MYSIGTTASKRHITGNYILERHLKNGLVFISADDRKVHLVNGLFSTWEDITNIHFGKTYFSDFKEIYLNVKRNGNIIKSL